MSRGECVNLMINAELCMWYAIHPSQWMLLTAALCPLEALDASMRENGDLMSRSAGEHYGVGLYGSPQGTPSTGTPVGTPPGPKVASIKARPSSKRMTAAEVEDLLQHGTSSPPTSPTSRQPQVYASVAEMKKAKVGDARLICGVDFHFLLFLLADRCRACWQVF